MPCAAKNSACMILTNLPRGSAAMRGRNKRSPGIWQASTVNMGRLEDKSDAVRQIDLRAPSRQRGTLPGPHDLPLTVGPLAPSDVEGDAGFAFDQRHQLPQRRLLGAGD